MYVEKQPYTPDGQVGNWLDGERPAFRLDRQDLEQEGFVFIPVSAYGTGTQDPIFYKQPREERSEWSAGQLPKCLEVFNLSWHCTMADVKEAYRRLVKHAHPDGGGSQDKFIKLQEAYEQALRLF